MLGGGWLMVILEGEGGIMIQSAKRSREYLGQGSIQTAVASGTECLEGCRAEVCFRGWCTLKPPYRSNHARLILVLL